jgi:hypothetical protein
MTRRKFRRQGTLRTPELAGRPLFSRVHLKQPEPHGISKGRGRDSTELEFAMDLARFEIAALESEGGNAGLVAVAKIGSLLSELPGTEEGRIWMAASTLSRIARRGSTAVGLTATAVLVSDLDTRVAQEWTDGAEAVGRELALLASDKLAHEEIGPAAVFGMYGILSKRIEQEVENSDEKSWHEVVVEDRRYGRYTTEIFGSVALHGLIWMLETIASSFIEKPSLLAAGMLSAEIENSINRTDGMKVWDARHKANIRLQEMLKEALTNVARIGNCHATTDFASEMLGIYFGIQIGGRGGITIH